MNPEDITRAITATVAFASLFAGHYAGDQWLQTGAQACGKALDVPGARRAHALWCCARHVLTYSLAGLGAFLAAAAWLDLPIRPGWVVAGLALNAVTHYVVDLRTPLRWMARKLGRGEYVERCAVMRPSGAEQSGPGTALYELDQAWHLVWIFLSALLFAGS